MKSNQFRQFRGEFRKNEQEKLNNVTPYNRFLAKIDNIDLNLLEKGNTQFLIKKDILRKAKSEFKKRKDLVTDCDVMDVMYKYSTQNDDDKYIYSVTDPLFIVLFRKDFLKYLIQKGGAVLYFDATGNVARKPKCHPEHKCKKVYYYAIVTKFNNITVPIIELISAKHDTISIKKFLLDLVSEIPASLQLSHE